MLLETKALVRKQHWDSNTRKLNVIYTLVQSFGSTQGSTMALDFEQRVSMLVKESLCHLQNWGLWILEGGRQRNYSDLKLAVLRTYIWDATEGNTVRAISLLRRWPRVLYSEPLRQHVLLCYSNPRNVCDKKRNPSFELNRFYSLEITDGRKGKRWWYCTGRVNGKEEISVGRCRLLCL